MFSTQNDFVNMANGNAMMLSPLRDLLRDYQMILASTSPQRKAIWEQMGLKFVTMPSSFDEEMVDRSLFASPDEYVKHLARCKAEAVVRQVQNERNERPSIVVGADTVIVAEKQIIGKPHTPANAIKTLQQLSGKAHHVKTGVAILSCEKTNLQDVFVTTTDVYFADLHENLIRSYVETEEPLNKAGGYGIQGMGARLVKSISGDYYNVVGFPLHEFCERLETLLQRTD